MRIEKIDETFPIQPSLKHKPNPEKFDKKNKDKKDNNSDFQKLIQKVMKEKDDEER